MDKHLAVAQQISDAIGSTGAVAAVWLVGSVAAGHSDEFSDVDLVLLSEASPEQRHAAIQTVLDRFEPLTWRVETNGNTMLTAGSSTRVDLTWLRGNGLVDGGKLLWRAPSSAADPAADPAARPAIPRPNQPHSGVSHPDHLPIGAAAVSSLLDRAVQIFFWSKRADQMGLKAFERLHRGDMLMAALRQDIFLLGFFALDRQDFVDRADAQLGALLRATFFTAEPGAMARAAQAAVDAIAYIEPGYSRRCGLEGSMRRIERVREILRSLA